MTHWPSPHAETFYVFRSPSLPFGVLEAWSSTVSAREGGVDAALEADREALRGLLREAVGDAGIREALFLASPDLEATLDPWLRGDLAGEKGARVERSLVRYLSRMAFRCTPFGLFAGTTTGAWGGCSLELEAWKASRRHTRMDMDVLAAIVASIESQPEAQAMQIYRPNTSLYATAGRLRYAEARGGTGKGREYHLVDLTPSVPLASVLKHAAGGAPLRELAEALAREVGATFDEAMTFCEELVASQILVGSLQPPLTGEETLDAVVATLMAEPGTRSLGEPLGQWSRALDLLDGQGPGNPAAAYRALADDLAIFPVETDLNRLFQVDQHRPARSLELPERVRRALEGAVDTLRRLSPPPPPGALQAFRNAFAERYEGRWMPLLEVLDSEAGIGFGGDPHPADAGLPLLDGMAFPGRDAQAPAAFSPRDGFLLRRIQALGEAREWHLDDADLAFLENPEAPPFPATFAAVASLAAESAEALGAGDFQVVMEQFSGPSGARLLARFCQGDPDLEAKVRTHLETEEAARPGAVFAEVVHLPDGRTGNILARPTLRAHEIPFLGVSGVDPDHRLLPSELLVNVVEDRVVLWSPRLGKEVVPRLSSAHNYSRGLAVYRFLGQIQDQEGGSGAWSWGSLREAAFLPRVVRGRHVLSRARWRLEKRELERALEASGHGPWGAFALLRERRGLPRLVVLEDADNTLLVDLEQPLWTETLWHLVRRREAFVLTECFPDPGHLPLRGPEGRFTHEMVVPFRREAPVPRILAGPGDPRARRSFPPGSEWLYAKIYGGRAAADRVLLEGVAPLVEATRGLWDRWFFVRYADPLPHIRLRFHGHPDLLTGELLPWLHRSLEPLRTERMWWRLQLDTYEPEMDRYGGAEGLDRAEQWFWRDSEDLLENLGACLGDEGAQHRWKKGLVDVDRMLEALGMDPEARLDLVKAARGGFLKEFGEGRGLEAQMGARFRPLAPELEALLETGAGPGSAALASLATLGARAREGAFSRPLEALAPTLAHMHLNRLLRGEHRAQECMLMDFLQRTYARVRGRAGVRP